MIVYGDFCDLCVSVWQFILIENRQKCGIEPFYIQ